MYSWICLASISSFLAVTTQADPKIMVAEATSITTAHKTPKTVYLIRHAESEENRRLAALSRTFKTLGKFKLPSSSDVYASTELLNVPGQVDSNVSKIGAEQIARMKEKLSQEEFVKSSGIQLVAHSPLLRARQTSVGMLGCMAGGGSSEESTASEQKAESVSRVVQTELLLEKTPAEWTPLYFDAFVKRIRDFEKWLWSQEEDTIALVGHSQFFKAMLGLDFKFGNCEVWKVDFDLSQETATGQDHGATVESSDEEKKDSTDDKSASCKWNLPPQWSNLELKYGCDIEGSPKSI